MPLEFTRERKPDAQSLEAEQIVRDLAAVHGQMAAPSLPSYQRIAQRAAEWMAKHAG